MPRCESRPTSTWCNRREPVVEFYAPRGCSLPLAGETCVLDGVTYEVSMEEIIGDDGSASSHEPRGWQHIEWRQSSET